MKLPIQRNTFLKKTILLFFYSIAMFGFGTGSNIFAQAGTLDSTFGSGGIDTTIFGGGYGQSVVIQPDKKIVIAGGGNKNNIFGVGVIRYDSTGKLDPTFADNGKAFTDIGGEASWGNECALQADGKIVVAGYTITRSSSLFGSNVQNFLILRYNTDGSLDNTFGTNGSVVTGFNQKNGIAASLAIQTDGKIVTAGVVDRGSNAVSYDYALVRYNSDGSLDNAFGNSGMVFTDFNQKNDIGNSVKLQADGKIVVAGPAENDSGRTHYSIARYELDGSPDSTFGIAGKLMTSITGGNDAAYCVSIQDDGKFIVSGGIDLDNGGMVGLIKYNSNGTVDSSFGTNGIVKTFAGSEESRGFYIVTQTDNKILVTGLAKDSTQSNKSILLIRYNENGTLDDSFGTAGIVKTVVGDKDDEGYSIAIQTDKKIVVAGWTKDANDDYNYVVARYNGGCEPQVITTNAPASICEGTSLTLTASGSNSYAWSDNIKQGEAFTPGLGIHTYTLIATNTNNCKDTTYTTITVNALPTVGATANLTTLCLGDSVTLKGNGANSYSWTDGEMDNVSFAPTETKTYTVVGTDANNCSAKDSINITVNAIPLVIARASDTSICTGNPLSLYGEGANIYTWTDGIVDGIPFSPSTNKTYTVTGTDTNNCSASDTIRIIVNENPVVSASANIKKTCNGATVALTGSGADTYAWSNSVINDVPFTVSRTSTYTVTGTDLNNCSATDTISIFIDNDIVFTVTANASSTIICSGDFVSLTGDGASTYSWSGGVNDGESFSLATTTTFTLTGTDTIGCTAQDTISIWVNELPNVIALSSKDQVCLGDSVSLTGSGASSYSWSDNVNDGIYFIPSSTNTYTLTGTDANNCISTDTITIKVSTDPPPTVIANASESAVCPGTAVSLSGSGAVSYAWTNDVTDGIPFVPVLTADYTLTGTDANGCSNTATISIVVKPAPTVIAHASVNAVCSGDSVLLYGEGAISYSWSANVTDSVNFSPDSTQFYILTGTDENGCSGTDSIQVMAYNLLLGGATASSSKTTLCSGDSVTLSGFGAENYFWSGGVIDRQAFVPEQSTTYTLTAISNNSCDNTTTLSLSVNSPPLVIPSASPSSAAVCYGSSVTLNGSGAKTYVWSDSVVDAVAFVPSATKTYTVIGTDSNNCSSPAIFQVSVFPLPTVGITAFPDASICEGDSIILKGTGAKTYSWSDNVTDSVFFFPSTSKVYTVTGKDVNSCSNTAFVSIEVDSCKEEVVIIGIEESNHPTNEIEIYPNPSNGNFTITLREVEGRGFQSGNYKILNELGQTIQELKI